MLPHPKQIGIHYPQIYTNALPKGHPILSTRFSLNNPQRLWVQCEMHFNFVDKPKPHHSVYQLNEIAEPHRTAKIQVLLMKQGPSFFSLLMRRGVISNGECFHIFKWIDRIDEIFPKFISYQLKWRLSLRGQNLSYQRTKKTYSSALFRKHLFEINGTFFQAFNYLMKTFVIE